MQEDELMGLRFIFEYDFIEHDKTPPTSATRCDASVCIKHKRNSKPLETTKQWNSFKTWNHGSDTGVRWWNYYRSYKI